VLVRILFVVVLIGAVLFLLKRGSRSAGTEGDTQSGSASSKNNRKDSAAEQMVPCKQCGVHLPQSEAVRDGDTFFCSDEHLRISKQDNRDQ